jgi:Condensation domain
MERDLNSFEHLYWLYNQFYPMDFATVATIHGQLNCDQLAVVLKQVQHRHPLLRVRIATDAIGQPKFVETDGDIPIRQIIRIDDQQWQQELEVELSHSLDWQTAPLLRVVLVQSETESELIIICHHAIADGLSGIYLMRDVIQGLGGKQFERAELSVAVPLESAFPGNLPCSDPIAKRSDYPPPQSRRPQPHVHNVVLSPKLTQQLIQCSRVEGTTVQGAISAAFLLALNPRSGDEIRCLHPVNVRSQLSLPMPDGVGLYICLCTTSHSLATDSAFWDIARSVKSQLSQIDIAQQLVEERQHRQPTMAELTDATAFVEDLQSQYPCQITVTNLGRIEMAQQYSNLQIAAIHAPVVMSGVEQGRIVGVATLGDRLSLTLTFSPQIEEERAERDRAAIAFLAEGVGHLEQAVVTHLV